MRALGRVWPIPLAVIVSLVPLWPVYGTFAAAIVIVAGTLLGTTIAWVSFRRKMSALTTVLVTLVLFFLVGVPLAVPGKTIFGIVPTFDGLATLAASVVLSWKQLVTVATPVGSYEALLVPALVLSLVVSLLGVAVALRPKVRALAMVPPAVCLAAAIWLGPVRGFEALIVAGAMFLLVSVWFTLSGPRGARVIPRAIGVVALPLVVALGAGAFLTPPDRVVWRQQVEQPFVLQSATSPLSEYRAYVTGEGASQLVLSATGLASGDRISLATLDRYDGVVFSVGGTAADFVRMPSGLQLEAPLGKPINSIITIERLSGPWVPLPAELGTLTFEGSSASNLTNSFYYSASSATGAVVGGLAAGDRYRVSGIAAPILPLNELAGFEPGFAAAPPSSVIPQGLDAFVTRTTSPAETPGAQLASAVNALLSEGYVSDGSPGQTPSRSGHGAQRLTELFAQTPMVGDAEQYAAAAALIARQTGFPARVVMGLIVPENGTPAVSEGDSSTVALMGSSMSAWIEISTTEGWVGIDPNPVSRPIPDRQPDDPTTVSRPQTGAVPPPVDVPRVQDQTPPEAAQGELTPPADPFPALLSTIAVSAGGALLLAGLVALPFVTVWVMKARRRARRRSAATTIGRITGAWAEFADTVRDHGIIVRDSYSRRDLAKIVPQERAVALAKLVDRAQFAPAEPTQAQVEEAWRTVDQVRVGLEEPLTRSQRARTRFSLRSLRDSRRSRFLPPFRKGEGRAGSMAREERGMP